MNLELNTLGAIRVASEQGEIQDLMRQKLRLALFVYLAVEGEASREGVAGMFWRDRDPDRARHSLSQTLYALRRTLGDGWLNVAGDRMTVTSSVLVDSREFERLAERGETGRALECYTGSFLGPFSCGVHEFDHWADRKRAALDRLHRRLRKEALGSCLTRDDVPGALIHARMWVAVDSTDDEAQHQYIQLLAASGERSQALRQYEIYRDALASDDLTPLEQTEELIRRLRAGEPILLGRDDRAPSGSNDAPSAEGDAEERRPQRNTRIWGASEVAGPRLVRLIEGGREGESYPLTGDRTEIGRTRGDLLFPQDGLMSSLHASIQAIERPGALHPVYVIKDQGSRNGVFVRIHGDRPVLFGDVFAAGKQVFQFDRAQSPNDPPEASGDAPGAATRLGLPEDFL